MTGPAVEVHRVRFHRNGVGGAPFYLVEFTDQDGDGFPVRLIASVWVEGGESPDRVARFAPAGDPDPDFDLLVSVVDIDNPAACWRGDVYADVLLDAIREADRTRAAYT